MEESNLEQAGGRQDRIESRVTLSRDKRWVIERILKSEIEKVPGSDEIVIIKPVTFWEAVIRRARAGPEYDVQKVKE